MSDNEFETIISKPTPKKEYATVNERKPVVRSKAVDPEDNLNQIVKQQQSLVAEYRNEKQVPVQIAPSYAKYFGNAMTVSINGICVTIPCDGRTHLLPETFATEIYRRMHGVDAQEIRLNAMGNISRNFDGARPGDLDFF